MARLSLADYFRQHLAEHFKRKIVLRSPRSPMDDQGLGFLLEQVILEEKEISSIDYVFSSPNNIRSGDIYHPRGSHLHFVLLGKERSREGWYTMVGLKGEEEGKVRAVHEDELVPAYRGISLNYLRVGYVA